MSSTGEIDDLRLTATPASTGRGITIDARASDGDGYPVADVRLAWSISGGATLSPATSLTDEHGRASTLVSKPATPTPSAEPVRVRCVAPELGIESHLTVTFA